MRVGVSTGPLYAAILGTRQMSYEVFGKTNDCASLCEQKSLHDKVTISEWTLQEITLHIETDIQPILIEYDDGTVFKGFILKQDLDAKPTGGMLGAALGGASHVPTATRTHKSKSAHHSTMGMTVKKKQEEQMDQDMARKYAFFARRERQRERDDRSRGAFSDTATSSVGTIMKTDRVMAKYTEHASCCGRTLQDPDAEAEYMQFYAERHLWFRKVTRCGMFALILIVLLCFAFDDTAEVGAIGIILMIIALLISIGTTIAAFLWEPSRTIILADVWLQHFCMLFLIVGLALTPRSVTSNDPTWVGVPVVLLVSMGY